MVYSKPYLILFVSFGLLLVFLFVVYFVYILDLGTTEMDSSDSLAPSNLSKSFTTPNPKSVESSKPLGSSTALTASTLKILPTPSKTPNLTTSSVFSKSTTSKPMPPPKSSDASISWTFSSPSPSSIPFNPLIHVSRSDLMTSSESSGPIWQPKTSTTPSNSTNSLNSQNPPTTLTFQKLTTSKKSSTLSTASGSLNPTTPKYRKTPSNTWRPATPSTFSTSPKPATTPSNLSTTSDYLNLTTPKPRKTPSNSLRPAISSTSSTFPDRLTSTTSSSFTTVLGPLKSTTTSNQTRGPWVSKTSSKSWKPTTSSNPSSSSIITTSAAPSNFTTDSGSLNPTTLKTRKTPSNVWKPATFGALSTFPELLTSTAPSSFTTVLGSLKSTTSSNRKTSSSVWEPTTFLNPSSSSKRTTSAAPSNLTTTSGSLNPTTPKTRKTPPNSWKSTTTSTIPASSKLTTSATPSNLTTASGSLKTTVLPKPSASSFSSTTSTPAATVPEDGLTEDDLTMVPTTGHKSVNLTSVPSDMTLPDLDEEPMGLNWTLLADPSFGRLVKITKRVAEAKVVELFLVQVNVSAENEARFISALYKKVGPIILSVRNTTIGVEPKAKLVVVVVDDDIDVHDLIDINETNALWESTNYYIIVTANIPTDILQLFRTLWNVFFVSNVIFYSTDGSQVVNVYNPFKNSTEVTSLNIRSLAAIRRSMLKKMNDLNGYPIRVSIFPTRLKANPLGNGSFSGPDGVLLSTLAKRMNFKAVTAAPSDGKKYGYKNDNGSFTGVLGDLINDRADISFNSAFIKDYETTEVQFTRPIDFDQLCLVVAKSGLRPHWKGMFLAFTPELWIAWILTFFVSLGFWCTLRKLIYGVYELMPRILDLYRIFIMFPIEKFPGIESERIAVLSFLWFSLWTTTIFQASMVKFLSYPSYEPDINTLQEVADKNYPIISASLNLKETFESDEPIMMKLFDNFQVMSDKNVDILSKVAFEGSAAALGRMNDLEEKIATGYIKNNIVLLHVVADCPKAYHIGYMLPRDSPFLESINKVISIFVESGIIHSWYIHSTPFRPLSDYHQSQETYKPLTMKNVTIAFIIIIIGAGFAFVAFIIERATRTLIRSRNGVRDASEGEGTFGARLGSSQTDLDPRLLKSKSFQRSLVVYESTRRRFKPFKNA